MPGLNWTTSSSEPIEPSPKEPDNTKYSLGLAFMIQLTDAGISVQVEFWTCCPDRLVLVNVKVEQPVRIDSKSASGGPPTTMLDAEPTMYPSSVLKTPSQLVSLM